MKTKYPFTSLIVLFTVFSAGTKFLSAQSVSINNDGSVASSTAMLDVKSTTKGMLIPRMSASQRLAITLPATGLVVYDTDAKAFWYFNGTVWEQIAVAGNTWSIYGNNGTNANGHFIGTIDATDVIVKTNNSERMRWLKTPDAQNTIATISTGDLLVNGITIGRGRRNALNNMAIGSQALFSNSSGSGNTAIGFHALFLNTSGENNTANGNISLYSNTTGGANTGVGQGSLYSNTTGNYNTAAGNSALFRNTTGDYNTSLGNVSLGNNETGTCNTGIGHGAGTALSNLTNATAIGYGAIVNANNKVVIGNSSVTVIGGQVGWSTLSDGRFKTNIKEDVPGLDFIMQLRPVNYNFLPRKFEEHVQARIPDSVKSAVARQADTYTETEHILHTGFIAQEVEQVVKKNHYKFNGVHAPANESDNYSITYDEFVVPLVKAAQQLNKKVDQLSRENELLKQELEVLKKRLEKLEAR